MTTTQPSDPARRWRIAAVLAGATMAIGGPLHPESDAKDSLRDELATMTSGDTWVVSHSLIALGTVLLAVALWSAWRQDSWPTATRRALHVAAVTMSLYVVETVFHLASVVDSDALANGDPAPVAFAHVGLALLLYPVSGLSFAWLNVRLVQAAAMPWKLFGAIGIVAGLVHATSVPATVLFPDAELTPMFASAGMLMAAWALGLGIAGVRASSQPASSNRRVSSRPATTAPDRPRPPQVDPSAEAAYRRAEADLWASLHAQPTERRIELGHLGVSVRVQEVGHGEPVLYVHGGPSAGTNWAPLAAHMTGFRSIIVDRPGTGLSEHLAVTGDDLDGFADRFVLDVLDALGLEQAHVVASSFGGFLALRAATVAPHRVDRMVQMACPAGAPGMAVPPFMRAAAVPVLRRVITALPPNERAATSMLRQIGHGATVDAGGFSPEFMAWYLSLQRDTETMRNDLRLVGSVVTARGGVHPALALSDDLLRRVEVPTFFYWGTDDPFGGRDVAERLVANISGAQIEMVARSGHLPWLDDPSRAARAVATFLRTGVAEHVHLDAGTPARG